MPDARPVAGFVPGQRSAEHGFTVGARSAEHGFTVGARSAEHGFTLGSRSAEHGFTLIEVMVALAVFSLAALALIRLEGATLRSTEVLGRTEEAQLVARDVALEAVTDASAPALGPASGTEPMGAHLWRWTRQVSPVGDGRVVRIDVAVADARGQVLGRMTAIRPPDPPPVVPGAAP